jgi:hypothetical protein
MILVLKHKKNGTLMSSHVKLWFNFVFNHEMASNDLRQFSLKINGYCFMIKETANK